MQLQTVLAWVAAIPFVVTTLLVALGIDWLPVLGNPLSAIQVYGLVIASFMAGIHWGQYLSVRSRIVINVMVSSSLIAFCLWVFYLWIPVSFIRVLVVTLIVVLLIDTWLYLRGVIDAGYFGVRCMVTLVVCLSLILIEWL